jgi:hypothetical protein
MGGRRGVVAGVGGVGRRRRRARGAAEPEEMLRSPACSFFSGGDCFLGFFSFFLCWEKKKLVGKAIWVRVLIMGKRPIMARCQVWAHGSRLLGWASKFRMQ